MLTRYRWYRLRLPRSSPNLRGIAAAMPFSLASGIGFVSEGAEDGEERFRFYCKAPVVLNQYDSDGTQTREVLYGTTVDSFAIIRLRRLDFLRLENPRRTARDLFNAIEKVAGPGFAAAAVTFDRMQPTSFLANVEVAKLQSLRISGAVLDKDIVARIEFSSNEGMKRSKLAMLKGLKYAVDFSSYDCSREGVRGHVAISSSGMVRVSGPLGQYLMRLVEKDLPSLTVGKESL